MSTWFTYIARCADGSLYTGISTNLERRMQQHNDGKGAAYTRGRGPIALVWSEKMESESAARKSEARIKRLTRTQKELVLTTKN